MTVERFVGLDPRMIKRMFKLMGKRGRFLAERDGKLLYKGSKTGGNRWFIKSVGGESLILDNEERHMFVLYLLQNGFAIIIPPPNADPRLPR